MRRMIKICVMSLVFLFANNSTYAFADFNFERADIPKMSIYPNPASNMLTIDYNSSANYQIVISNILGSIAYKSESIYAFEKKHTINLSNLHIESGIYLVKIYEGKSLMATQKLVVRRP